MKSFWLEAMQRKIGWGLASSCLATEIVTMTLRHKNEDITVFMELKAYKRENEDIPCLDLTIHDATDPGCSRLYFGRTLDCDVRGDSYQRKLEEHTITNFDVHWIDIFHGDCWRYHDFEDGERQYFSDPCHGEECDESDHIRVKMCVLYSKGADLNDPATIKCFANPPLSVPAFTMTLDEAASKAAAALTPAPAAKKARLTLG